MEKNITISNLQEMVNEWVTSYGVRYFSELTNLGVLMEEVGELARIMVRVFGDQSFKRKQADYDLGDEIADILFVLVCIANQTNVDLETAIKRNFEKKTSRDQYRHINNPKL